VLQVPAQHDLRRALSMGPGDRNDDRVHPPRREPCRRCHRPSPNRRGVIVDSLASNAANHSTFQLVLNTDQRKITFGTLVFAASEEGVPRMAMSSAQLWPVGLPALFAFPAVS
jgi:hypothetical protein